MRLVHSFLPTALLLFAAACSRQGPPGPPDFLTAESVNQRVTAIQFLPDDKVEQRLADLRTAGATDPSPRVRNQVAIRLGVWGQTEGLAVLRAMHRDEVRTDVARTALRSLRDACWSRHGDLRPDRPPKGPIPGVCAPAYDGTWSLPQHRPPPRLEAEAFWKAQGVPTKTLPSGELWPASEADRRRVFASFPEPR